MLKIRGGICCGLIRVDGAVEHIMSCEVKGGHDEGLNGAKGSTILF